MEKREILKRLCTPLLAFFLCVATVFCGQATLSASAATEDSAQTRYEQTNVLNNLKGSTVGGKEFDLADYPHNSKGKPQIISFIEFCYSYYAEKQTDYGLYVYVYNPQDTAFDMATERNKIQLTYGDKQSYSKYTLEFINYSTEAGYEGRFWKFKVKLTDSQKSDILRGLDSNNRIYKVSGIELSVRNTVTEYPCGQTYTYKGFALGYGSELAASDTLSCKVDGFEKYLSLDVHSTYYRPDGSNGSKNKQDTLHSVYFSVPDEIIDEYGEMTAVHATWLNAFTAPIVVTGNKEFYDAFMEVLGQEKPKTDYGFHSPVEGHYWGGFFIGGCQYGFNDYVATNELSKLNYVFYADNGDADTYALPAEALVGDSKSGKKGWFETYTAKYGGEKVISKYSKALFEQYDDKFTDITITDKDSFKLTSVTSSQSLWQSFWGTSTTYTNTYKMSAIQKVTLDDMDKALSSSAFCKEYFVAETDYDELHDYVKQAKAKKETVYLFRYKQSEYFAVELRQGKWKTGFYTEMVGDMNQIRYGRHFSQKDTNAYLCQMWVQLDFDIIDLTFTKDGVDTVIPVIMSPMDIAADGTPPLDTTKDGLAWWKIVLGLILFLVIFFLLLKFAPAVVYAVSSFIALPFKGIGKMFKAIGNGIKKSKERRQQHKEQKEYNKSAYERELKGKLSDGVYKELLKKGYSDSDSYIFSDEIAAHEVNRLKQVKNKSRKKGKRKKVKYLKPPDLSGNVSPEEVDAYLDSIDWDSVDWTKLDGLDC